MQYNNSSGTFYGIVAIVITICGIIAIFNRNNSKTNNVIAKKFMMYAGMTMIFMGILILTYSGALIGKYILIGSPTDIYVQLSIVGINVLLFFVLMAWYKKNTRNK